MKRFLTIFVLSSAGLFAQSEIAPEQLKAATELTTTMGLSKQMEGGFNAMLPMIANISKQLNLDDPGKTELVGIYKSWFAEDIDQAKIKEAIVKLYAEMFTKDELVALNDFYKSPVGQKALTTLPELTRRSSAVGMQEAIAAQGKLQERLKPFMETHQPSAPALPK